MWSIVGILLAIIIPLGIEWLRRPRLSIEWAEDANQREADPPWRIVHIKVINAPLHCAWSWFLQRNSASGCRVGVEFVSRSDGRSVSIPGRWSATPQPLSRAVLENGSIATYYNAEMVPQTYHLDVAPHPEGDILGIAIKADGAARAYAFTAESYQDPGTMRLPRLELPDTDYDVNVTAQAGGIRAQGRFRLTNAGDLHTGLTLALPGVEDQLG